MVLKHGRRRGEGRIGRIRTRAEEGGRGFGSHGKRGIMKGCVNHQTASLTAVGFAPGCQRNEMVMEVPSASGIAKVHTCDKSHRTFQATCGLIVVPIHFDRCTPRQEDIVLTFMTKPSVPL